MKKYSLFLMIGFLVLLSGPVFGEEVRRLDIAQSVDLALQSSEDYQIAEREIDKRHQQYKAAKSAIYPQINGSVTWEKNFEYPLIARTTTMDYGFDAGLSASQLIWSFGKVSSAIKFAGKYENIGKLEKDAVRLEIVYLTKVEYYSVIFAGNVCRIREESLKNSRESKTFLQNISSAGRSSKKDLLKIDADIASRIPPLNDARSALDSALRTLKVQLGIPPEDKIILSDGFAGVYPDLDREKYVSSQNRNEPTLKALDRGVKAQEDVIKIKRAAYYPTLSAFASWDEIGIGDNSDLYSGNTDNYGTAGVKVSMPLWSGGQINAELQQARIDKYKARLSLRKAEKQFSLGLENAIFEYRQYLETLAANREAVRLAKESFEMMRDLFGAGQVMLSDLNDAELLLTGERIKEQQTLYNINVTMAKIERLAAIQ